jgi:hypothetical protein
VLGESPSASSSAMRHGESDLTRREWANGLSRTGVSASIPEMSRNKRWSFQRMIPWLVSPRLQQDRSLVGAPGARPASVHAAVWRLAARESRRRHRIAGCRPRTVSPSDGRYLYDAAASPSVPASEGGRDPPSAAACGTHSLQGSPWAVRPQTCRHPAAVTEVGHRGQPDGAGQGSGQRQGAPRPNHRPAPAAQPAAAARAPSQARVGMLLLLRRRRRRRQRLERQPPRLGRASPRQRRPRPLACLAGMPPQPANAPTQL